MTNKDFYAYCRDQRNVETDPHKKAVLQDVYKFMWECGVTKSGVAQYIDHQIFVAPRKGEGQPRIEAYRWLQSIFSGQATASPQQGATLF